MSRTDEVTENPNDKQSPGKPLGSDEVAPTDNNGLGPVNGDEDDEPALPPEAIGEDQDAPGGQHGR